MTSPQPPRSQGRIPGRVIFWIGLVVVALITGYVVKRILDVSGPGPDPSTIPERPGLSDPGS